MKMIVRQSNVESKAEWWYRRIEGYDFFKDEERRHTEKSATGSCWSQTRELLS
jgi:hypothetical protein